MYGRRGLFLDTSNAYYLLLFLSYSLIGCGKDPIENETVKTTIQTNYTQFSCETKSYKKGKLKMVIEVSDLGIDYRDAGPWRSYSLDTYGNTLEELLENATIGEIDQDGGELNAYGLADAPNDVAEVAGHCIEQEYKRKNG